MKLHKKIAIVFTYIALCIAVSGYLYLNPDYITINSKVWKEFKTKSLRSFKNSLVIEGVGLFLLLGWVAYKGDKKEDK